MPSAEGNQVPDSEKQLSRREREIMDVVYAKGRVTALEVVESLDDPPGKTAVRTLLRILEEKGHLTHKQDGQTYVYRATKPRGKAGKSALRRVLSTFFDSSLERAVAAHLGDSGANITDDELDRITQLIAAARSDSSSEAKPATDSSKKSKRSHSTRSRKKGS